ncbi:MAG: hypothetical protein OHK0029_18650 [Armatimonadaceae bacterium]
MVVLVVLLAGVLLAIRVFPLGFGILQASGNRSLATRLAQQQIDQLGSDAENLPLGVLMAYPSVDGLRFVTEVDPDRLSMFNYWRTNDDIRDDDNEVQYNPYFADVNKFRYIKGEAVRIPLPTSTGYGTGSVYTCKFGPIFMDATVGNPSNAPQNAGQKVLFDTYLAVYGSRLSGRNVESPGAGVFAPRGFLRSQQNYVIDYGEDDGEPVLIAFGPRSANANRTNPVRTFRVTITYYTGNGLVTSTIPVEVNDDPSLPNGAGKWISLGITDALPGSETVVREFDRIPVGADWDRTDPYQYKLRSPNIITPEAAQVNGGPVPIFANLGVLNFNPTGGNYNEENATGTEPFTAFLDYAVLDWHILKEDREVPNVLTLGGGVVPLRLSIPRVKRVGDAELDNTFYNGLYGDANNPVDIQVFNLNDPTGLPLVQGDYNGGSPVPMTADYYVDFDEKGGTYRSGTVYFNTGRLPAGTKLRILYKAQGDWAVAVQKAYNRYEVATTPQTGDISSLPLRGRYDAYGVFGQGANAQLRFPLCDLNKTFVVTIQYTLANGTVRRLAPISMTAKRQADEILTPEQRRIYDKDFAVIDLRDYLPPFLIDNPATPDIPDDGEFSTAVSWEVAEPITGVSLKVRVIWREDNSPPALRQIQDGGDEDGDGEFPYVPSYTWRVQDMDTYLTPKSFLRN